MLHKSQNHHNPKTQCPLSVTIELLIQVSILTGINWQIIIHSDGGGRKAEMDNICMLPPKLCASLTSIQVHFGICRALHATTLTFDLEVACLCSMNLSPLAYQGGHVPDKGEFGQKGQLPPPQFRQAIVCVCIATFSKF